MAVCRRLFNFVCVKRVAVYMVGLQSYGVKLDFNAFFGGFRRIGYAVGGLFLYEQSKQNNAVSVIGIIPRLRSAFRMGSCL